MRALLTAAVAVGQFRAIDLHGALFLEELSGRPSPSLLLAAALASQAVGEGHICLPLGTVAGQFIPVGDGSVAAPALHEWRRELLDTGVVGAPGGTEPLILDGSDRLYLARYHAYESLIAEDLRRRSRGLLTVDRSRAAELLAGLFPDTEEINGQKLAAAVAAVKRFMVITGGPGTGKTYTVARIIALLQGLAGRELRISLAAPTGRAAARLQESILLARESMSPALAAAMPQQAGTLHRLLGLQPENGRFRYNRHNPLHLDLLVIDEASMVDVPLMAALLEALPAEARLIVLGDRDQLTSVEAGSLFGDICGQGQPSWSAGLRAEVGALTGVNPPGGEGKEAMADSLAVLTTGFRFRTRGGIGALAKAVNTGDQDALTALFERREEDLVLARPEPTRLRSWLAERLLEGYRDGFAATTPSEALAAFGAFRVLCAVREGVAGVVGVNMLAEEVFRRDGLIHGSGEWYRGRPIMIRKNHYALQLFNGDTGIVWPDREGRLQAWFARPDGEMRPVALSLLPTFDTAYAATVHQAQGSEYEDVLLLLPLQDSRLLSRELVYTGLTRARRRLILADPASLLPEAIARRALRYSGLGDALWKATEG